MNISQLIEKYIENPESIYENLSTMDEKSRKIIYFMEEVFAGLKFRNMNEAADEQQIAEMADKLRKGKLSGKIDPQDLQAVSDVILSLKLMSHPEKKKVPDVLMSVIERTQSVTEKNKIPSFIVQLTENGIKTILSGLNGMNLIPVTSPAMRSAATLEQEDAIVQIEQNLDNMKIHYNVVKESDEDIMLSLHFADKIGRCRIVLKENDRMISTENLNDGDDTVTFRQLKPGYYDITISGSVNHSFSILVNA